MESGSALRITAAEITKLSVAVTVSGLLILAVVLGFG